MDAGDEGGMAGMEPASAEFPKGLMVSQAGYTFQLATPTAPRGPDVPISFTIVGPDGSR